MSSCKEIVCPFRSFHRLCVAVGLLFLLAMSHGQAQVTIKERVEITPPAHPSMVDSSHGRHAAGNVRTTVFGVPLREYQQGHTRGGSTDNPSDEEDSTIAIINPTGIYRNVEQDGETFFTASGTFELPEAAEGEEVSLILHGGELVTCCGTVFGLGADDAVIVKINGEEVFSFNLIEYGQFIFEEGLDLTYHAHPGTNTFEVTAFDIGGYFVGLPPMRLGVKTTLLPGCILLSFAPPQVSVGEVTSLIIKQLHSNGVVDDFPEEQWFIVRIAEGYESYGDLISTADGDTSDVVSGFQNEFQFIAAPSIPGDTVVVRIIAELSYPSRPGQRPTKEDQLSLKQEMHDRIKARNGEPPLNELMENECATYWPLTVRGEPELVIVDPAFTVVPVTKDISSEPVMPTIVVKAQMKNFNGGSVSYSWRFSLAWSTRADEPNDRIYNEFVGTTQEQNSAVSEWTISWANPPLQTKIRGGDKDTLFVEAVAGGVTYKQKVVNPFRIIGHNATNAMFKAELASGYDEDKGLAMQVLGYKESTFRHFFPGPGFPFKGDDLPPHTGDPNDFGICQINKPKDHEVVWNWKANILAGKAKFNEKYSAASNYHHYVRQGKAYGNHGLFEEQLSWYKDPLTKKAIKMNAQALSSDQRLRDAMQGYNGGAYYRWYPKEDDFPLGPREWVVEPPIKRPYEIEASQIFDNVKNGGPLPGSWNTTFDN